MSKELKEVAQEVTSLIAKKRCQAYEVGAMRLVVEINQELSDLLDRLDELSKPKQIGDI